MRARSRWYESCMAPCDREDRAGGSKMRLALALTTAVLLAVPSGATRAAKTCHGQSCAHGGAGSGSGGSPGGGQQGGSPGQGHSPGGRGRAACDAARCTAQATIDENCACDTAANHGDYVKCVAHALEQMAVAGTVPRPCVGRIIRCASRSTCGKAGTVTCQVPASTCDSATSTCANDPSQGHFGTEGA